MAGMGVQEKTQAALYMALVFGECTFHGLWAGLVSHNRMYGEAREMTPTIFQERGYRFFFFSREELRMHVHVVSGKGEAKFWLEPEIRLARSHRYSRRELAEIENIIEVHRDEIISAWQQYFSG